MAEAKQELTEEQKKQLEEVKKQCPFCQIVAGNIPATKVFEDDKVIAILDINPAVKGHVLLVPKEHYFIMTVLPPDVFAHMVKRAKEISACVEEAMLSQGTEIFVANGAAAGQQSGHMMIHIVPREDGDGLNNFDVPKKELPEAKLKEMKGILENNLKMALGRRFGKLPPQKFTKDQVIGIINKNPQIKQLIDQQPEQFIELIPSNPSLQQLFKDVDPYEIIEAITGKKIKKKKAEKTEEEREKKEKQKKKPKNEEEPEQEAEAEAEKEPEEESEGNEEQEEPEQEDKEEKTDLDLISKLL
ncbi:HIT domain-containing protein [Candidatus Woesearchaeota archaeon]|nr:HIT domain-containing protein [Candidatus Woesearchaeota archaeon]